jgi:hypothetical protein
MGKSTHALYTLSHQRAILKASKRSSPNVRKVLDGRMGSIKGLNIVRRPVDGLFASRKDTSSLRLYARFPLLDGLVS